MKRPAGYDNRITQAQKHKKTAVVTELDPAREQKRLERERRRTERAEYRRFTGESRRRRRNMLIAGSVGLVLVGTILVAVFSPLFAIRTITVTGTERLDALEIEAALSAEYGVPLPLLKRDEIGEKLQGFHLIESYAVEVQLPDTLVIRLTERTPLMSQQTASGFALFDAAGVIMSESDVQPEGYPVLVADALGSEAAGFAPAVSVLRSLPSSLLAQVVQITATTQDDVSFVLGGSQKTVVWGDATETRIKATLLGQLLENLPDGQVYDISSTSSPSVR